MSDQTPAERTLDMLNEREGCVVVAHATYRDMVAYVFTQDTPEGVRSYGYCVPHDNGESWAYFPQKQTFKKPETDIIKMVRKEASKRLQDDWKELVAENRDNDEDSTE